MVRRAVGLSQPSCEDSAAARVLLHDKCGDCSGRKVDTLWRPVLKSLSGRQAVIPIFTLNYDWTFEKLAIEGTARYRLIDGFELLGGAWDAGRFADIKPEA